MAATPESLADSNGGEDATELAAKYRAVLQSPYVRFERVVSGSVLVLGDAVHALPDDDTLRDAVVPLLTKEGVLRLAKHESGQVSVPAYSPSLLAITPLSLSLRTSALTARFIRGAVYIALTRIVAVAGLSAILPPKTVPALLLA